MSTDCECPKCGRLHRNLGFGQPPAARRFEQKMLFYGVTTPEDLIGAMAEHISSLQAKLPKRTEPFYPPRVREG